MSKLCNSLWKQLNVFNKILRRCCSSSFPAEELDPERVWVKANPAVAEKQRTSTPHLHTLFSTVNVISKPWTASLRQFTASQSDGVSVRSHQQLCLSLLSHLVPSLVSRSIISGFSGPVIALPVLLSHLSLSHGNTFCHRPYTVFLISIFLPCLS